MTGDDFNGFSGTISKRKKKKSLAERGFDPRTSGLWAQHASTAPLCFTVKGLGMRAQEDLSPGTV